jgi:linoleoyl-CoA desaturase
MNKYTFDRGGSPFFKDLKGKVDNYFTQTGLQPTGDRKLLTKGAIQISLSVILYVILVFFTPPASVAILLCAILGITLAMIGFNVMHEGGHNTFSRRGWMNRLSAYSLNILGGISYYWKIKHNVNHHTYTNIEGMDSDIDVKPLMRLHPGQPWRWFHRFQHIYWLFLYALSYLAWIFYEDFEKYFRGRITPVGDGTKMPFREHLVFWLTKIMYVTLYMILPILFVGFLPWLIGFLIITLVCGLTTSIVFQLAHVVEGTQFHSLDDEPGRHEWAIHQVVSTANFGTQSRFLHWVLGGLNFQVEHHLFPRVSHVHYPAINRYVRQVCRQYNVSYTEYSSMLKAIVSHVVHLRKLGQMQIQ